MKSILLSAVFLAFIALGLVRSENTAIEKKKAKPPVHKSSMEKELDFIAQQYDSTIFKALYSIDDFRPNSIISVDKISRMYENKWLSPELVVSKLTADEKECLLHSTALYLDELGNTKERQALLDRLKFWCMADLQFKFMKVKLGIIDKNIIKALIAVPAAHQVIAQLNPAQPRNDSKVNQSTKEQEYSSILNYICTLPVKDQYKFYSEVYNQLSEMGVNN